MEVSKFKALADKIKAGIIDKAAYVNFFGNDTVYIFSIKAIARAYKEGKIKIENRYCNKTTAVYSGKVLKATLLLPKSIAIKIVRINNKWIKQQ
jgi:hypothetical protein